MIFHEQLFHEPSTGSRLIVRTPVDPGPVRYIAGVHLPVRTPSGRPEMCPLELEYAESPALDFEIVKQFFRNFESWTKSPDFAAKAQAEFMRLKDEAAKHVRAQSTKLIAP